jgi:CDP-diacylglycerol---glycerol-3-phosphate 3-phosphatidyltransferase
MSSKLSETDPALHKLQKKWVLFAVLCLVVIGMGYSVLRNNWRDTQGLLYATRWTTLAAGTMLYQLLVLWKGLKHNYRPSERRLLSSFGPGNSMTLLRGVFVAGLAGFLLIPRPEGWLVWVPGMLYVLAAIADFLDGYLARITGTVTRLGEILDMSFDGLGVLIAALLAVRYEQVPVWYLSVALARYFFLGGIRLRTWLAKPVYELPPSTSRRTFAGMQMGFIAIVLLPVFSPPGTYIAATAFALPFLLGFSRDWLAVSGVIQPAHKAFSRLQPIFSDWAPVLLRLAILFLSAGPISQRFLNYSEQVAFYNAHGMPSAMVGVLILAILEVAVVSLLLLGVIGRVTAVVGLLVLGVNQIFAGLTTSQILLLIGYTAILFTGTGVFSMWTPENRIIFRRAGEA